MGRSPFINRIDTRKIKDDCICINSVVPGTKPKYLVSADFDVKPVIPAGCEWISENNDWYFFKNSPDTDIITKEKRLSWCYYSSSLAVNFAILRGYNEIYLCGIDLIETKEMLEHYDDVPPGKIAGKYTYKEEKEFIKNLCNKYGVQIYNLNPECDWLPFKDIGILK